MAVDFRCENCGKLLSVDADAGSSVTCVHCKKKVTVPAGLASLPRPHVPPNGKSAPAPQQPLEAEAPEEAEENPAVLSAMAHIMPWVISAFFHLGLFLIMVFVVMFVQYGKDDLEVIIPDAVFSEDPGGRMNPGEQNPEVKTKVKQAIEKVYAKRDAAIQNEKTDKRVELIGVAGAAGGPSAAMNVASGSRAGPKSSFFGSGGNAHHIVYVVDRSGSMSAGGVWDIVRREMLVSVSKLREIQDFHIILFAEGPPLEPKVRRLAPGTRKNKIGAADFLQDVIAQGRTNPVPALNRAFDVMRGANRRPGKLIYLLTDGAFPDNKRVLKTIESRNKQKDVKINTYLYGHEGRAAVDVMTRIAGDNGGIFKTVEYE